MQKTGGHVQWKRMVIGTDPKDIYINHKFPSVYWSHHHCGRNPPWWLNQIRMSWVVVSTNSGD
jgi:hypothetical protein